MCQVSLSELGLICPLDELGVDFIEGALDRGIGGAEARKRGGQTRTQDAIVEAGEEQRGSETECGDAVSKAVVQAFDQAMETQSAQLVSDCALGDRLWIAAGQSGKMVPQIGCAEAVCDVAEQDERMQERMQPRIGKAQAGGALAACRDWTVDGLEGVFGEHAIVAQTFDFEEPAIGRKADLAQLGQIVQAFADAEVVALMVVSVRKARFSLWYCLIRVFL